MEVNFGKIEGASAAPVIDVAAQVTPTPTAPAPVNGGGPVGVGTPGVQTSTAVAAPVKGGLVVGDKLPEMKDIMLPRINIVQGIGKLKDTFPQGGIIFGQNTLLFEPPTFNPDGSAKQKGLPPVNMTVLGFRDTRYVEKIKGGERGLIVNTEAEVTANGGTLDYNEWKLKESTGIKRFEPLAEALVAIRRPDHLQNDGTTFVYDADGHQYALAIWAMKGVVYTAAAKRTFFTARQLGALRKGGYPSFNYNITTKLEKYPGGNAAWVPVCLIGQASTAPFLEFVSSVLASD